MHIQLQLNANLHESYSIDGTACQVLSALSCSAYRHGVMSISKSCTRNACERITLLLMHLDNQFFLLRVANIFAAVQMLIINYFLRAIACKEIFIIDILR